MLVIFLQVVLCAGSDLIEEYTLGYAAAQHDTHAIKQLLLCEQVLFLGQILRVTQPFASGNNGHLSETQSSEITSAGDPLLQLYN